jgi:hypothetical protein
VSYDLYMLRPEPGVDPMETLERLSEQDETVPIDPAVAERNRRVADALLAGNPAFSEFEFDHEALAQNDGTSLDEARQTYRWIELTDESGLQVTLYDQQAAITFPYWDSLDAGRLMEQIGATSKVIEEETGWRLYDPQLEKFLDPARDGDEFRAAFAVGVGATKRIAAEYEDQGRAPWWRRVFGRR